MHFPLKLKLLFLLVMPIFILAIYMYNSFKNEYDIYYQSENLIGYTHFTNITSQLLYDLQIEYAYSTGSLQSETFTNDTLLKLQEQSEESEIKFTHALNAITYKLHPKQLNMQTLFDELKTVRQSILTRSIRSKAVLQHFTKLNDYLYSLITLYLQKTGIEHFDSRSTILKELVLLQKQASLERTLLTKIFASTTINADEYQTLQNSMTVQNHYEDLLHNHKHPGFKHSDQKHLHKQTNSASLHIEAKLHELDELIHHYRYEVLSIYQKNKLLAKLKMQAGYGGLIHTFKNYILRGDERYYRQFLEQFSAFKQVLHEYQVLASGRQSEYTFLLIIEETFQQYRDNIEYTKQLYNNGLNPLKIDHLVSVNDTPAIEAFSKLQSNILGINPHIWFDTSSQRIALFRDIQLKFLDEMDQTITEINAHAMSKLKRYVLTNIAIMLFLLLTAYVLAQHIVHSIRLVRTGLREFFYYINAERNHPPAISLHSKDELEAMANEINTQIQMTLKHLDDDHAFINEASHVAALMRDGNFTQSLQLTPHNQRLKQLHTVMNELITPLIEARDKAIATEKAKDEFLSNMSHEIRTPLNAILGFVKILNKHNRDEKMAKYLGIVDSSGQTLLTIINDILDFAKIQSGSIQIDPHPFDPLTALSNTALLFGSKAYEKELDYLIYIDPNIPECLNADLVRIQQIFANLLSNAIKFTPEHGRINVRVNFHTDQLSISIKDSGIGMNTEQQARIFNSFEQADGSTTRKYGGTGLGLSISKKLTELMHGTLSVESRLGEGSTFTMSIPASVCSELKRPQHDTEKIHALKIGLLPSESEENLPIELIREYLHDFGITQIESPCNPEQTGVDIIIFIPDEHNTASVLASEKLAIALEKHPDSHVENCNHILSLHAPYAPSHFMDVLDDITVEDLRIREEEIQEPEQLLLEGHLLIAEDNRTNQMLIGIMLDEYELEHTIVNNGQEALEAFMENTVYDLILMDENMPVLNGIESMKQIKAYEQQHGLAHTPIVALTASMMQGDRERFLSEGMDDFVGKPINTDELETMLLRFLPVKK